MQTAAGVAEEPAASRGEGRGRGAGWQERLTAGKQQAGWVLRANGMIAGSPLSGR